MATTTIGEHLQVVQAIALKPERQGWTAASAVPKPDLLPMLFVSGCSISHFALVTAGAGTRQLAVKV